MKKHLLLILFSWCYLSLTAQWHTVGTPSFTGSLGVYVFSSISPSGEPHIAYADKSLWARARVKKFDGTDWIDVGNPGFSAGDLNNITSAFSNTGDMYVAYSDAANGDKATVKKLSSGVWTTVGIEGFTPSAATYTSIAVDTNGTPYVAFRDIYMNYRASVMKFDGTNWVYVGSPGFSALGSGHQGASYVSLVIDKLNALYVCYSDHSNDFSATVMKYEGTDWVCLGGSGFSAWQAGTPSITLDSEGTPFVIYSDRAYGGKATVMQFVGSSWISVGSPGFTDSIADYTSIDINSQDQLFITFKDYNNAGKASAMTFDGTDWLPLGLPGFSSSQVKKPMVVINKNTDEIYVGYEGQTYLTSTGATVMKYSLVTGTEEIIPGSFISLYPNPAKNKFFIKCPENQRISSIKVINSIGVTVYTESFLQTTSSSIKEIDLGKETKGLFYVEIISEGKKSVEKIVLN